MGSSVIGERTRRDDKSVVRPRERVGPEHDSALEPSRVDVNRVGTEDGPLDEPSPERKPSKRYASGKREERPQQRSFHRLGEVIATADEQRQAAFGDSLAA